MKIERLQRYRLLAQMGFFTLFTVTPLFDLFRYDLTERHAYFLTYPWHLGIDELMAGTGESSTAVINIILYLFLPVLGAGAAIIGVAWKWGRLYCGWLCPHFSVVETINRLMLIASGKHSVWDKKQTPPWEPDGTPAHSTRIVLVDRDGRLRGFQEGNDPEALQKLLMDIGDIMREDSLKKP